MLQSRRMKRRRWPDVVIVLAILVIGAGGVWTLWGDELSDPDRKDAPASPAGTPST